MEENNLLEKVKSMLGITVSDPDMDKMINFNILAVKEFLIDGGAEGSVGEKEVEVSCIAIGVNDLMNQAGGSTKFSPAFKMLANQICRR